MFVDSAGSSSRMDLGLSRNTRSAGVYVLMYTTSRIPFVKGICRAR